jgi:hypothetical protein
MTDKKISALTAATTPLGGTEVFPIVQSSATVKATIADVQAAPVAAGTANGVTYLNGTKVPTSGTQFNFNGTEIGLGTIATAGYLMRLNGAAPLIGLMVGGTQAFTLGAIGAGGATFYYGSGNTTSGTMAADWTVTNGNLAIGAAGKGIDFSGNGGVLWRCGAGTPEGVVTAPVGSLYTNTSGGAGTTLYVKESGAGNTGWVAK